MASAYKKNNVILSERAWGLVIIASLNNNNECFSLFFFNVEITFTRIIHNNMVCHQQSKVCRVIRHLTLSKHVFFICTALATMGTYM